MTTANLQRSRIPSYILRTLIFLVIWWVITDGNLASWGIGLPAVLLAVITSIILMPATKINWYQLFKFLPYFIMRSFVGGIDVAQRAFHQLLVSFLAQVDPAVRNNPNDSSQLLDRDLIVLQDIAACPRLHD